MGKLKQFFKNLFKIKDKNKKFLLVNVCVKDVPEEAIGEYVDSVFNQVKSSFDDTIKIIMLPVLEKNKPFMEFVCEYPAEIRKVIKQCIKELDEYSKEPEQAKLEKIIKKLKNIA